MKHTSAFTQANGLAWKSETLGCALLLTLVSVAFITPLADLPEAHASSAFMKTINMLNCAHSKERHAFPP